MSSLLIHNVAALQLFLTEDIYVTKNELLTVDLPPGTQTEQIHKPVPGLATETAKKDWNFTFVGENQKKVLILVNDAANQVSTPEGVATLKKLIKSISLLKNDFALLNYANHRGVTFADLEEFFECKVLLSFGVDNNLLQLPQSNLHTLFIHQQVKIIISQRIDFLNKAQKNELWTNLKQLN